MQAARPSQSSSNLRLEKFLGNLNLVNACLSAKEEWHNPPLTAQELVMIFLKAYQDEKRK